MKLPAAYTWLDDEPGPKVLLEARRWYGTQEAPGPIDNPAILAWAAFVGASSYYKSDATPWCALFLAFVVKMAGFCLPRDPLRALSWEKFGMAQKVAMLGDVLVMERAGGGHVTLYVGEDATHYHGLGGNQGDAVSIVRFPKSRITAIRRCPWKFMQPENVRVVPLSAVGLVSKNEA